MVSTRGPIHRRAASSILALSTRDDCCVAEKTVIGWCGIGLRVTGAAQWAALGIFKKWLATERSDVVVIPQWNHFADWSIATTR
jgi:hypothetical protein